MFAGDLAGDTVGGVPVTAMSELVPDFEIPGAAFTAATQAEPANYRVRLPDGNLSTVARTNEEAAQVAVTAAAPYIAAAIRRQAAHDPRFTPAASRALVLLESAIRVGAPEQYRAMLLSQAVAVLQQIEDDRFG